MEDEEWMKLPVEDKVIHKLWKARLNGYEEATKQFKTWDEDDLKWKSYLGLAKKMVIDSNAVAQEKGLECCLAFAENCKAATKTTAEVIEGLVSKCVAAPKTKTKDYATQICLMYCEIETHEKVIEQLLSGFSNKNPKVVSGCVNNVTECLRCFGAKVIKISPLLKAIIPLMDHRDKDVREGGKKLIIEAYRWIGDVMKVQLKDLKEVQMKELEEEFGNLSDAGRAKPERWLRSQGPPKETVREVNQDGEEEEDEDDEPNQDNELDVFEMLDPVEILSKLPKDFYEKVEQKKWQDRKEALDALFGLVQNPKLQPGDYIELVKVLRKFITKDTNVMLVALAAQCMTGLAKGLRSHFKQIANNSLSNLLEKFKEKKLNVVSALRDCVDAFYPILGIETIQEDCLAALKIKTPTVKSETCLFLARCFSKCPTVLTTNKKVLKGFISALLECLNEADPTVRDSATEALATLWKFLGESKVMPFMPDLDKLKLEKIKEKSETIELSGKSAAPKLKKVAVPAVKTGGARVTKPTPAEDQPAGRKTGSARGPAGKVVKSAGTTKKAGQGAKGGGVGTSSPAGGVFTETDLSLEECEARAGEVYTEDIATALGDNNWKVRLAAIEEAKSKLETASDFPGLVAVKLLCKKPGLKDNNFQVLGSKIIALRTIAKKSRFSQQMWDTVTPEIVGILADKKNCEAVKETFYVMAEYSTFNFIFVGILDFAFAQTQKSPIVKAEALNWSAEGIKLFGFGGLQPRAALDSIKKGLAESNPTVRTAAIGLLAVLHWYMGATAKRMFEDEKDAIKTQIDKECDKYKDLSLPIPTRGGKLKEEAGDNNLEEESEFETQTEDLVPRQDISPKLNDDLCSKLSDKNWKIRKEGLDELKDIVSSAKFITSDLAGLPASLAPRTTDANKILAVQAIEMIENLSLAMGPHTKPNIPHLLPPVLAALADSKQNIRTAAVSALNTLMKETSVRDMMVGDIFPSSLCKGNPFVRQEIFNWLGANLLEARSVAKEELTACLGVLFASLEDRSADVRKAAQEAIKGFMKHLGFQAMNKATEKLSPVSKNAISPLLDKARGELPQSVQRSGAAESRESSAVESRDKKESSKGGSAKSSAKVRSKPLSATTKKKEEEIDSSPLYQTNKLKNTRFREEAKLKLLKWNFTTPRQEFVDQLKDQLVAANFNKSLMAMMFHTDFKQHLKALDMMISYVDSNVEALISNVDLILKWMTLRFFETNPSVNLKGLEYLTKVFTVLSEYEDGYNIHEIEATSFIPYLIIKIGDPKDQIRASCKTILRLIWKIYPASKLFNFVMVGISTKNAKQRTECLDEIGHLISMNGTSVAGSKPSEALKEMAKQIGDRDTSVRNAALNAITETYFQEGEKLYRMIGNLPDKDLAMLEERIKRASKTRQVVSRQPAAQPIPTQSAAESRQTSRPGTGLRPPSASSAAPLREAEQDLKIRFQQNRAQSAGRNTAPQPRPTSGAFTLDLAKIEGRVGDVRLSCIGPKLVEHNLDEIINDSPVTLPVTRTTMRMTASPENDRNSGNRLLGNQEAHQAVNATIAQIFTQDTSASISALAELDELMKDNEKVELLHNCIDHLLSMCCMQYRHVLDTKMKVDNVNNKEIMRQLQFLTMVLMSLYGHRDIVKKASMQVLHDLVNIIVLLLLEPSVPDMPEGAQLVRALNVLTVKIVDRSDHNNVSTALIKLLQECIGSSVLSEKYCVLIMKCIWKVIRGLPTWLETMDTANLLADIHSFLMNYPASYWKQQADDTPMRTIKTVIHTVVKCQGDTVLSCLSKIQDPQSSELLPYITKLLNTGVGNHQGSTVSTVSAEKKKIKFSKSDHEALVEIFKKIGQKELTKAGLQELYNFKQENPHVVMEPFLAQSSQYFRDYIERGLRKIEEEVKQGSKPQVLSDNSAGVPGQPQHLVYLEKLRKLRAQGGLESDSRNVDQENVENYSKTLTGSSSGYSSGFGSGYNSVRGQSGVSNNRFPGADISSNQTTDNYQEENQNAPQTAMSNVSNVDEIRKRLAKIKAQAF